MTSDKDNPVKLAVQREERGREPGDRQWTTRFEGLFPRRLRIRGEYLWCQWPVSDRRQVSQRESLVTTKIREREVTIRGSYIPAVSDFMGLSTSNLPLTNPGRHPPESAYCGRWCLGDNHQGMV